MKFKFLLFALLSPVAARAADEATQTRGHYAAVDRAVSKATIVKRDLDGYSGEGGELTAYFQNGAPLKMVARHFFSTFRLIDELYFWQGRLFFVLETKEYYYVSDDGVLEMGKVTARAQNRFYFDNGQLARWMKANGKAVESGNDFKAQQKEQLQFAREMLAGARSKAKKIVAP